MGTAVVVIILVIVGAVVGVNATKNKGNDNSNKYPDYYKLNYTLVDTCMLKGGERCLWERLLMR